MATGGDGKQQAQPPAAPPSPHCCSSSSPLQLLSLLSLRLPLRRRRRRRVRRRWRRSSGMARSLTRLGVPRLYSTRSVNHFRHVHAHTPNTSDHAQPRTRHAPMRGVRNDSAARPIRAHGTRATTNETIIFLDPRTS